MIFTADQLVAHAVGDYLLQSADLRFFWNKVDRSEPFGCWLWTGATGKDGYGLFDRRYKVGKAWRAHRLAYELAVGPIPDGLMLRHTCDVPLCCYPWHLIPGTARENSHDMVERRRHWTHTRPDSIPRGDDHWTRRHGTSRLPSGVHHPQAKMTPEKAAEVRDRYVSGGVSQRALAAEYAVSQGTIWQILRNGRWSECSS